MRDDDVAPEWRIAAVLLFGLLVLVMAKSINQAPCPRSCCAQTEAAR